MVQDSVHPQYEFAPDDSTQRLAVGSSSVAQAKAMVVEARKKGTWVLLQNCHLYKPQGRISQHAGRECPCLAGWRSFWCTGGSGGRVTE